MTVTAGRAQDGVGALLREALPEHGEPHDGPWRTLGQVLADDAALLRERHATEVSAGATRAAAAKWLAAEYGGQVLGSVVLVLVLGRAGVVLDAGEDRHEHQHGPLRWRHHPDGWVDRVDLGAAHGTVVAAGHPWTGLADVEVVAREEVAARAVASVAAAVAPLVEACRALAKVGRAALWAEVADGATAVAHATGVPVAQEVCAAVDAALRGPGVPWRKVPLLQVVTSTSGPLYAAQKGGCCLAHQCAPTDPQAPGEDGGPGGDAAGDPYAASRAAVESRFPPVAGERRYCETCSLRPLADCVARQVVAHEHRHLLPH